MRFQTGWWRPRNCKSSYLRSLSSYQGEIEGQKRPHSKLNSATSKSQWFREDFLMRLQSCSSAWTLYSTTASICFSTCILTTFWYKGANIMPFWAIEKQTCLVREVMNSTGKNKCEIMTNETEFLGFRLRVGAVIIGDVSLSKSLDIVRNQSTLRRFKALSTYSGSLEVSSWHFMCRSSIHLLHSIGKYSPRIGW